MTSIFCSRLPTIRGRVALLAGPVVTLVAWAAPFIVPEWRYAHPSDAWAVLPPLLVIGTLVGIVAALVFGLATSVSRSRAGSQDRIP